LRGGHFAKVYGFKRNDRDFVLRLTPPNDEINVAAQKSILAWMAYLAAHDAPVPEPLPSENENLVEVISSPEGQWLAVAFTQAEGELSEEIPLDQWDDARFQMLGRSIGQRHAIARDNLPSTEVSHPQWETGGNPFNRRIENELWLKEKQSRVLEQIRALPRSADTYGPVHCDLHFGNFFVDVRKQTVTLIDFDDRAYGWFVMEIAILLSDSLVLYPGTDKDEYGQGFLRSFLTGYLTENSLSMFWPEKLPPFLKLLEFNIYDRVAKPYPDHADERVMKFMPGRKERLENNTPSTALNHSALARLFI
jgi:amicoumacin kinase